MGSIYPPAFLGGKYFQGSAGGWILPMGSLGGKYFPRSLNSNPLPSSPPPGLGGPHECSVCRVGLEHFGQSRALSPGGAQSYGLGDPLGRRPDPTRVCNQCHRRRQGQCETNLIVKVIYNCLRAIHGLKSCSWIFYMDMKWIWKVTVYSFIIFRYYTYFITVYNIPSSHRDPHGCV